MREEQHLTNTNSWQPREHFAFLRDMANAFGSVVTRKRNGNTRHGLRFRIEGTEYYSWSVPVAGRSRGYSSREMAQECLDEIRSDIKRRVEPLAAISPYCTNGELYAFSKFWDLWTTAQRKRVEIGEISKKHADVIGRYQGCDYLDPILDVSIYELDFSAMEDLKAHLLELVSPKTTHNVLADVRTCLRALARKKGMPAAPDIPTVKVPQHTPNIPTRDEQDRLLNAIPYEIRGYWLARGLLGVRDEEAARALLSDYRRGITEDADEWLIRGKGGRDRLLPVPVELAQWVRAHLPALAAAGTVLFVNPTADLAKNPTGKWYPNARQLVFKKAQESIGCPKKWKANEALRHCFGTRTAERLLREGTTGGDVIRQVMMIMGHSSSETSARYVRLGTDALRGALQ